MFWSLLAASTAMSARASMDKNYRDSILGAIGSKMAFTNTTTFIEVNARLSKNEKIIGKFNSFTYDCENKSTFGDKHIYITDFGRILAYDDGGFFGSRTCRTSPVVFYNFVPKDCCFEVNCDDKFKMKAEITLGDYLRLSNEIKNFRIDYNHLQPIGYFKDGYFTAGITLEDSSIKIKSISRVNTVDSSWGDIVGLMLIAPYPPGTMAKKEVKVNIELSFIKNFNYNTELNQCSIEFFSIENQKIEKIEFIFMDLNLYNAIKSNNDKLEYKQHIFNHITDSDELYYDNVHIQTKGFMEDDNKVTNCLVDSFKNSLGLFSKSKSLLDAGLSIMENVKKVMPKNNKAFIVKNYEKIKILDSNTYDILLELYFKDCLVINHPVKSCAYIDYGTGTVSIPSVIKLEKELATKAKGSGFNYSFISKGHEDYLVKVQVLDNHLEIYDYVDKCIVEYSGIQSMDILEKSQNGFVKINIKDSHNFEVLFKEKDYINILEKCIASNLKNCSSLDSIYYTWSTTIRDIIIFYYFVLPSELKAAIDSVVPKNGDINSIYKEDKIKLINTMYDVLKRYKIALMEFSGYFSHELYEEQAKDNNPRFKYEFDMLQKEMMSICNQINGHIAGCINNLNYLTAHIYPELDIREALEKQMQNRLILNTTMYAGMAALTGALTLVVSAGLCGYGIFDSMKKGEIIDSMEEHKINIYLGNAVSEFNIFIDKMMPKYIGDIYSTVGKFVGSISGFYTNEDIDFLAMTSKNNKLFLETPISSKALKRKQMLVDFINQKTREHSTDFLQKSQNGIQKLTRSQYYKELQGGE